MFPYRVLPLPPNFDTSSAPKRPSISEPNSDTLGSLDDPNMTTVAGRTFEHGAPRGYSFRAREDNQHHHHHHHHHNIPRHSELSSPISLRSSTRLSRRRETSRSPPSEVRQTGHTRLPSISREGDLGHSDAPPNICLCQPDPKIPRPRNAFILFRQHHQASVVAQNPGLANPDISKIIGDSWRSSSAETKNYWKTLAEEEKVRHQKQYPDYRYQPRRAGRNSVTTSVATDPETNRCLKCGGKTMQAYNNLPTSGTPISPHPVIGNPAMASNLVLSRGSHPIGSPSYPIGSVDTRRYGQQSNSSSLNLRHRDASHQSGPDPKRRRYDGPISPQRMGSISVPPSFSQPGRRPSMPHPEITTRGHNVMMARPHPSAHLNRALGPALAPLQVDKTREAVSHGKAVEAMVMSIPALNKIKVLSKISPPLAAPGPASPPQDIRGALIAIEGNNEEAIKLTTNYLKDCLERDSDYKVRLLVKPVDGNPDSNKAWINTITSYHEDSAEMIEYITTVPSGINQELSTNQSAPPPAAPTTSQKEGCDQESSIHVPSASPSSPLQPTTSTKKTPIPILLLPRYQLTLTDLAASAIPILDEYSPTDHWQWMATLWRGIIGPDVTIVITSPGSGSTTARSNDYASTESGSGGSRNSGGSDAAKGLTSATAGKGGRRSTSPSSATIYTTVNSKKVEETKDLGRERDIVMTSLSSSSGGSSSNNSGMTGILSHHHNYNGGTTGANPAHGPIVDVRLHEARAVLLRGEGGGRVSESGLRRMGFEVGEWLRDLEGRGRR